MTADNPTSDDDLLRAMRAIDLGDGGAMVQAGDGCVGISFTISGRPGSANVTLWFPVQRAIEFAGHIEAMALRASGR